LIKDENFIHLKMENISNQKITLSEMSVTATENLLAFCSVLDFSNISLCAMEPHVVDTYLFLEKL
jgi:UDP-N-acetylglucosamine enolpyruvyl transferase